MYYRCTVHCCLLCVLHTVRTVFFLIQGKNEIREKSENGNNSFWYGKNSEIINFDTGKFSILGLLISIFWIGNIIHYAEIL